MAKTGGCMAADIDERSTELALRWVEETLGGVIVSNEIQRRWRPHHFLVIRQPSGSEIKVLLRGYRNPGFLDDDKGTRIRLERKRPSFRHFSRPT
jgi:hypothetical protein